MGIETKLEKYHPDLVEDLVEKYGLDKDDIYILSRIFEDSRLSPPQDWHCPKVGNFRDVSDLRNSIEHLLEKIPPVRLTWILVDLIRNIERFERELEYVDEKINIWIARAAALRYTTIENRSMATSHMEFPHFRCPKCHADLTREVEQIPEEYRIEPRKKSEKYPRIKV